jgi:hypothetical protein
MHGGTIVNKKSARKLIFASASYQAATIVGDDARSSSGRHRLWLLVGILFVGGGVAAQHQQAAIFGDDDTP